MLKRKIKQRKETYIWSVGRENINIQITCQGNPPTEEMTFKWNSEGSEEMSHLVIGEGPSTGWRNSKCKALRQEHDQQVQNRRGHSGWGRMNKGRRRRFSPERPQNPVMSLTGASLGTADTSARPTPSEYLPAFLLWIFRYFQKLTSYSYALALFHASWAGLLPITGDPSEPAPGFCGSLVPVPGPIQQPLLQLTKIWQTDQELCGICNDWQEDGSRIRKIMIKMMPERPS